MLIICRNLLKLFEIKLILVVIFTRREVRAVRGVMVGSHGPVELSGPSTLAALLADHRAESCGTYHGCPRAI